MSQKINATDVTDEEALNAVFFERADEFIKQANEFCRPPKVKNQTLMNYVVKLVQQCYLGLLALTLGLQPIPLKMAMKCVMRNNK